LRHEKACALLAIGWATATVPSMAGLYISYKFDFPTGAAIVCALGGALVAVAVAARFRSKRATTPAEPRV
jgi:zinc/manganese transport system permease protein